MEESEYEQVTGEQVELEPGQALVFQAKQKNYGYDTIELGNQTYEVKKWNTDKKSYILDEKTQVYETMTVVTRNHEAKEAYAAVQGKEPEGYSWEYALDLIGDAGEQITFHEGGGGGSGWRDCWTGDLRQYTAPDGFTACVINARGETFSVPLTPQYTTPDGGSFSLAPEREEVLP